MATQTHVNLVTYNATKIIEKIYGEAVLPLIQSLKEEMQANITAKKHFAVYLREDVDYAPNAPFVQASLRFNYVRPELPYWNQWRKNGKVGEEPEQFGTPTAASALVVIEGLPGGAITIEVPFDVASYQDSFVATPRQPKYDWGNSLGSRHLEITEKYLKSYTLASAKTKTVKELVEA
jgi:hypothetical protein